MKRWLAMLICLIMVLTGAQASVSVRMDDYALLLSAGGEELSGEGEYADIVYLGEDLFAAQPAKEPRWALMDASGALLTRPVYDTLIMSGEYLLAERGGLWGALDKGGSEISPFEYTQIARAPGGFWALTTDPDDNRSDRLYILGDGGSAASTRLRVHAMGPGGAPLLNILEANSGLWGYCDASGRMRIPARYEYASPFASNLAAVVQNGSWGVINEEGGWVLVPQFDFVEISPAGFILASMSRVGVWVFGHDGAAIAAFGGTELSAACLGSGFVIAGSGGVTLYDASARELARAGAGASVYAGLGESFIIADGPWGEECVYLHDAPGARFQNIYPLGDMDGEAAYAFMQVHAARYINDQLGEMQYAADMDSALYGVADAQGTVRIPAEYESIEYLGEGRILARSQTEWKMMDISGRVYWSRLRPSGEETSS